MPLMFAPSWRPTSSASGLAIVNWALPEMTTWVAPVDPLYGDTSTSSPRSFQYPSISGTDECAASATFGDGDVSRYRILVWAEAGPALCSIRSANRYGSANKRQRPPTFYPPSTTKPADHTPNYRVHSAAEGHAKT